MTKLLSCISCDKNFKHCKIILYLYCDCLENDKKQSARAMSIIDTKRICTRSKSQGDMKRKLSNDEPETILNDKKNKIDNVTIVSDDKNTVSQTEQDSKMEVEIVEKIPTHRL